MSSAELEGYVLDGMARAIWVHAYMIWATEVEAPPVIHGTWAEAAPDHPGSRTASMKAAKDLARLIGQANALGPHPMYHLLMRAGMAPSGDATPADAAFAFGEDLALVCIGTRERSPMYGAVKLPGFEVTLDDDGRSLSWDGGMSWEAAHPNPARRPGRPPPPPRAPVQLTVPVFARAVMDVVPSIREGRDPHGRSTGRFGSKVYVISIWNALQSDPRFAHMSRQEFNRLLVEANRTGALALARADARGEMNLEEINDSEIEDRGATFHAVRDPARAW